MKSTLFYIAFLTCAFILSSCDKVIKTNYTVTNLSNQSLDLEIKSSIRNNMDWSAQSDSFYVYNDTIFAFKKLQNTESTLIYDFYEYGSVKSMPDFEKVISNIYSIKIQGKTLAKNYKSIDSWENFNETKRSKEYVFKINEQDIQ